MKKPNVPKKAAKPSARNRLRLPKRNWLRQALLILIISFFMATALILYVFGFPDGFFRRLFSATSVFFLLIGTTVLGIVPVVNYVFKRWLQ